MGTRSRIGILNSNGTVEAICCYWNGYPCYTGKVLLTDYITEEKVRTLLSGGNILSLYNRSEKVVLTKNDFENIRSKFYLSVLELVSEKERYTYIFNPKTSQWFWTTTYNNIFESLKRLHLEDCKEK